MMKQGLLLSYQLIYCYKFHFSSWSFCLESSPRRIVWALRLCWQHRDTLQCF